MIQKGNGKIIEKVILIMTMIMIMIMIMKVIYLNFFNVHTPSQNRSFPPVH